MYVCVCHAVTVKQYNEQPELAALCGTQCGGCLPYIAANLYPGTTVQIQQPGEYSTQFTELQPYNEKKIKK